MIPVFEGLEPYLRWHVKGLPVKPPQTVAVLQKSLNEQLVKDGRGFVGAIGFSQGAKVVAGLLLEQQVRQRREGVDGREGFLFGVMFNGTTPPLTAGLEEEEEAERIEVPSLHVLGRDDPWREEGLQMFEKHFDPKTATLMEFPVEHRLPLLAEHTAKVTSEILSMYRESAGGRQMGLSPFLEG